MLAWALDPVPGPTPKSVLFSKFVSLGIGLLVVLGFLATVFPSVSTSFEFLSGLELSLLAISESPLLYV
ncbi:MAG: hypothetical protein CME70_03115 [Halobacteriovorax sp.]|nr:hypothetical protein [Halobacteriovorax sp.]